MRRAAKHWVRELLLLAVALAVAAVLVFYGLKFYYHNAYPREFTALIDAACAEKGLEPAFVYAVIRTESGFRPQAESRVGARGLMQMMPDAYAWIRMRKGLAPDSDIDVLFDPAVNVEYGTSMLRLLFDEFDSDENVLCAYHAGRGSLQNWLSNPAYSSDGVRVENIPFPDTSAYVAKVVKTAEIYRRIYYDGG